MKNDRKFPPNPGLREARLERGWSQQDLANLIDTTPVNISRWENGANRPYPYYQQRLSEIFGKTPDELGLVPPPSHDSERTPAQIILLRPPPAISRTETIPIARNPYFTGREPLLELLHERLSTEKTAALIQPQALFGLGGIGKTQTAAEYAFRYADNYPHVFWVLADTRETLAAGFVKMAQQLDLVEKDEQDQARMVAAVKRWLAANESWLLILDNADDLSLAQEFLPTNHKGFILFTTRAQASGAIAASIEVEKLPLQEGVLLLLRWSKLLNMFAPLSQVRAEDQAAAERIVQEMDGLPLAIIQAGAYIEETGCSLADYLRRYATHRKDLLERRSRLMLDYPRTVATTWSLSFQQIEQESPAAAELLRLCAFLAPDAIPEELLTRGAAELGGVLAVAAADPLELDETLEVLRRYSLVRRDRNTHLLTIHRLVQAVLKESMDHKNQRLWAERTVRAVNAAFPEIDTVTGENRQYYLQCYLPHIQECAKLIEQYHLHFPEAGRLLFQAGAFLYYHGFHPQSQSLPQQALAIREQVFGSEHPDVAESFNALALLARNQGDYEQAERLHRQALAIRKNVLGPNHSITAQSFNNLGVLYRIQGKYEQARQLLKQAISINEQALGSEHPDTWISIISLAKLYLEQRKYEQAERLLQQALAIGERVMKPEHPLIPNNLNLLARLYYEQGNLEQAETLWRRSLAILEKTFGPEHPSTAGLLNDLAELYFEQGQYTLAQSLCQRALSITEKLLGSEHPDTIIYREHLSRIVNKVEREQDGNNHPAPPPH